MTTEGLYGAVDLGGSHIGLALGFVDVDAGNYRLVARRNLEGGGYDGWEPMLDRIAEGLLELQREVGRRPAAVGVGCPGWVDLEAGVTRFLPNLPGQWRDVPVARLLGARLETPVRLLNDVRAATLGEFRFGAGRGVSTMALFALGTGIGGGVVIEGRLRLGPLGSAGELGHQIVDPTGPLCGCGNRGCLEAVASGPAIGGTGVRLLRSGQAPILQKIAGGDTEKVNAETMGEAARAGDEAVTKELERIAGLVGIAAANVVVTLHPELIVLGGGVAGLGDLLFDGVRQTIRERVRVFPTDDVRVEPAALGTDAGLAGVLAWAASGGGAGLDGDRNHG
ncbi:MAG: ROK family protein [Holophagales bacterium]|nr:ROK family protein [Holophagales bacterium]MYG29163.1 ROK family protein [Holophagales bacterium]MYI81267.1 ROK family protein [Holophagales bacterium]